MEASLEDLRTFGQVFPMPPIPFLPLLLPFLLVVYLLQEGVGVVDILDMIPLVQHQTPIFPLEEATLTFGLRVPCPLKQAGEVEEDVALLVSLVVASCD